MFPAFSLVTVLSPHYARKTFQKSVLKDLLEFIVPVFLNIFSMVKDRETRGNAYNVFWFFKINFSFASSSKGNKQSDKMGIFSYLSS